MNWKRLSGWMIAACCLAGQEIRAEVPGAPGISDTPAAAVPTVTAATAVSAAPDAPAATTTLWTIGERDGRPEGFALAPNRFRDFIARDFGYEDKYFLIGHSAPAEDFPYVLPGPADTWGGTWPTSGWRTHEVRILFGLEDAPDGECALHVDLADYSKRFPPLVKVSVNRQDKTFQLDDPADPTARLRRYGLQEPLTDTLPLTGDYRGATPCALEIPLPGGTLRKGGNEVIVTVLEGSWILFDRVALTGATQASVECPAGIFVRDVAPAPYELKDGSRAVQPLLVDVEWLEGSPSLCVELDGREIFRRKVEAGRSRFETPMTAVKRHKRS